MYVEKYRNLESGWKNNTKISTDGWKNSHKVNMHESTMKIKISNFTSAQIPSCLLSHTDSCTSPSPTFVLLIPS